MPALDGIRVVDFSRYLSGPTLTMLLADLGADVIKVETLPGGDPARESGPFCDGESVYYLVSNRNKRSLAINLRDPRGMQVCRQLLKDADILVQNFRPGVAERMGLGYEQLAAENKRLIYCSISGFGPQPPGSDLPGFDQTAQAMSGLMSVTGTAETGPLRVGIAVADSATGVFGALGVLAALHERSRTGKGQRVDCSLMESMMTLMSYQAQKYLSLNEIPGQDGNDHPLMFPQGTFEAADGRITIASGNEKMWSTLCQIVGLEHLVADPRFVDNAARMRNRVELRMLLEEALANRPAADWVERLNRAGIPSSPVLNVGQALTHPVAQALELVASVHHSSLGDINVLGTPVKLGGSREGWLRRPPPLLGEHSVELCREAGLSDQEIQRLAEEAVVAYPNPKGSAATND